MEQYLYDVRRAKVYDNAPCEDGEFLYDCDEVGIVWSALSRYDERLEAFFGGETAAED